MSSPFSKQSELSTPLFSIHKSFISVPKCSSVFVVGRGSNRPVRSPITSGKQIRWYSEPPPPLFRKIHQQDFNGGATSFSAPARQKFPHRNPTIDSETQGTIYVANVSYDVSVEDLRAEFQQFGTVYYVNIPRNKETGKGKGIAFITMDKDIIQQVIEEMDRKEIGGRTIVCAVAKRREPRLEGI